jgi:hypothetical protein
MSRAERGVNLAVSAGQQHADLRSQSFFLAAASASCPGLAHGSRFLHERLVNTSDIHQVAGPFPQNNPVIIQHLRAASGRLSALQQDETT